MHNGYSIQPFQFAFDSGRVTQINDLFMTFTEIPSISSQRAPNFALDEIIDSHESLLSKSSFVGKQAQVGQIREHWTVSSSTVSASGSDIHQADSESIRMLSAQAIYSMLGVNKRILEKFEGNKDD
jgi:hypothetical protein